MDALLINPPPPPAQRVSRGLMGGFGMVVGEGLCYPPLDLLYVAAILERDGHGVRIVDAEATGMSPEDVLAKLHPEGRPAPALVGLTTSSATLALDLALADRIKDLLPRAIVFVTGSQGSKVPDLAMHNSRVDAVVRGEPELSVAAMAAALATGVDPLAAPGLSVRRGESITHNPDRPLLKGPELDALPFPARHLLPVEPYRIPTMEGPIRPWPPAAAARSTAPTAATSWPRASPGAGARRRTWSTSCARSSSSTGVRNVVFRDPLFRRQPRAHARALHAARGRALPAQVAVRDGDQDPRRGAARGHGARGLRVGLLRRRVGQRGAAEEVQPRQDQDARPRQGRGRRGAAARHRDARLLHARLPRGDAGAGGRDDRSGRLPRTPTRCSSRP
jgi:hypothetical protein